jgi:hypothetical protein
MADTEYESAGSDTEDMDAIEEPIFKIKSRQDNGNIAYLYVTFLKDNRINLNPAYQRKFCWSISQQELLIDSLVNGYPIPSILIAETGIRQYECIDGQHRLQTIKQFIDNQFAYKDSETGIYYYYENNPNKPLGFEVKRTRKYQPLPEALKADFDDRQICLIIIDKTTKLTENHKRVLFHRLQNGTRVSAVHRIKNIDNPITNYLSSINYMEAPEWKQFTELYMPHTKLVKRNINNTDQIDGYCLFALLRIIYTYKLATAESLNIGSMALDVNISRNLKQNTGDLKEADIIPRLAKFNDFIDILETTKTKYYEPYLIILFSIYRNFGKLKLLQVLANPTNTEKYNKLYAKHKSRNINSSQLNIDYCEIIKEL